MINSVKDLSKIIIKYRYKSPKKNNFPAIAEPNIFKKKHDKTREKDVMNELNLLAMAEAKIYNILLY